MQGLPIVFCYPRPLDNLRKQIFVSKRFWLEKYKALSAKFDIRSFSAKVSKLINKNSSR